MYENQRLGEESVNKAGYKMKISRYKASNDIDVEFESGYIATHRTYNSFIKGEIVDKLSPAVRDIGIVGDKYKTRNENGITKEYGLWYRMIMRCFDENKKLKHPTYKDVSCCNEWLYYSNFYEWCHEQTNWDNIANLSRSALDKDIIIKGNKIYSPDACCLVPIEINLLFMEYSNNSSKLLGVQRKKTGNKYFVNVKSELCPEVGTISKTFDDENEAFNFYKLNKEKLIKIIAEKYYKNGLINERCYESMLNYKI